MDFGERTAFFAVYDGHGGAEVAEYCSQKLPQFLKGLESFKAGSFEQALKDAFMGFDATLLDEKVIEELRHLARKNPDYEDSDMDENDETAEEILSLHQEATMPLAEVLEKYKGNVEKIAKIQTVQRLMGMAPKQKDEAEPSAGPSSSSASGSGSSSRPSGSSPKKSASDHEVSSSSSKPLSDNEADTAEPSSSSCAIPEQAPDSTHSIPALSEDPSSATKPEQSTTQAPAAAAAAVSSEYKISQVKSSDDEAISSSSAAENGESAASSCPSSSSQPAGGSSSSSSPSNKATKVPNTITSSSLPETESDSSSDDENDETYKESQDPKPLNSDDDTTDEDMDEEELDEEEMSGEDDEDDSFDDDFMNNMETGPGKASGCTAVVALMSGQDLFVANAGDSRCVVCRGGKVVEMSFDHKPEDDIEFDRIRKAGGRVTLDGRVNGGLNLSRAIGDHGYKMKKELPAEDQMISALPDIKHLKLEPDDEFMVLACDGIWNYMTNEEVVGFVKQRIDAGKASLAEICEEVKRKKKFFLCNSDKFLKFPFSCSTTVSPRTPSATAPAATT